jgi:hypothetical protein
MSPSRVKAIVRPSGLTSTSIQLPSSTAIGTWRTRAPGGALTSHFGGFASAAGAGAAAGTGAGAGTGGAGGAGGVGAGSGSGG